MQALQPAERTRFLLYIVAPLLGVGLCLAMYFSGVDWLAGIASPRRNRELGLLEHLQNAVLLGLCWFSWRTARVEPTRRAAMLWRGLAAFVLLVFLEELDYGNHYISIARGSWNSGPPVNLHNQGSVNEVLKATSNVGMGLWLGILPLFASRLPARLQPWIASRWSLGTLLVGIALSETAHALHGSLDHNRSLSGNISEFRETITYWVIALYIGELALRREAAAESRGPSPSKEGT